MLSRNNVTEAKTAIAEEEIEPLILRSRAAGGSFLGLCTLHSLLMGS